MILLIHLIFCDHCTELLFAILVIAVMNNCCLIKLVEHPWQHSTASFEPMLLALATPVSCCSLKEELEPLDATLFSTDKCDFIPPTLAAMLILFATSKIPSISASWRSLSFLPPKYINGRLS